MYDHVASAPSAESDLIYITGGMSKNAPTGAVWEYRISTGEWSELAVTISPRARHQAGFVASERKLVVAGGTATSPAVYATPAVEIIDVVAAIRFEALVEEKGSHGSPSRRATAKQTFFDFARQTWVSPGSSIERRDFCMAVLPPAPGPGSAEAVVVWGGRDSEGYSAPSLWILEGVDSAPFAEPNSAKAGSKLTNIDHNQSRNTWPGPPSYTSAGPPDVEAADDIASQGLASSGPPAHIGAITDSDSNDNRSPAEDQSWMVGGQTPSDLGWLSAATSPDISDQSMTASGASSFASRADGEVWHHVGEGPRSAPVQVPSKFGTQPALPIDRALSLALSTAAALHVPDVQQQNASLPGSVGDGEPGHERSLAAKPATLPDPPSAVAGAAAVAAAKHFDVGHNDNVGDAARGATGANPGSAQHVTLPPSSSVVAVAIAVPSPTQRILAETRPSAIRNWIKGKKLGQGAYGSVYRCLDSDTGESFAAKEIAISDQMPKSAVDTLCREVSTMRRLAHPNVVSLLGFEAAAEHAYIFTELCPGGDLRTTLRTYGGFTKAVTIKFTRQVCEGLRYLHEHAVLHRDIKGANVLLTDAGVCKLADFGLAKPIATVSGRPDETKAASVCGTPFWMSPEVVQGRGALKASDVWSLGCTVFEMAASHPPFYELEPTAALFHIGVSGKLTQPIPKVLGDDGVEFVKSCMAVDSTRRPTCSQLLLHSFLSTGS